MQLVFFGETLEGFERDEVKNRLGQLLKLDDEGRHKLFSGARMVLKQSIDEAEALRHAASFAKIGARLHVEPVGGPVRPAPAAPAGVSAAPAPALAADEEQITCPNCGERQSKRILCRSCSTDMPMGIAAREEARKEAREARLAESRARRGVATPALSDGDAPAMLGFGFSGRMARLPYAAANSWGLAALFLAVWLLVQKPSGGRLGVFLVLALLLFVMIVRWGVLRFHDCNRSGWWVLLLFVPYLGFVAQVVITFMPGTRGDNDHGERARSGSWLKLALSLVALCLSVAMLWTARWKALEAYHSRSMSEMPGEPLEVPAALTSPTGRAAFSGPYTVAPPNKAFAASPGGPWGWKSGAPSTRVAVMEALARCEANREPYAAPCELIDVNDEAVTMNPR